MYVLLYKVITISVAAAAAVTAGLVSTEKHENFD
jgi:hypothetical protein